MIVDNSVWIPDIIRQCMYSIIIKTSLMLKVMKGRREIIFVRSAKQEVRDTFFLWIHDTIMDCRWDKSGFKIYCRSSIMISEMTGEVIFVRSAKREARGPRHSLLYYTVGGVVHTWCISLSIVSIIASLNTVNMVHFGTINNVVWVVLCWVNKAARSVSHKGEPSTVLLTYLRTVLY